MHRYYQARQQANCDASKTTDQEPAGCANDLYPWVEVTIGAGSNGKPQLSPFNDAATGEAPRRWGSITRASDWRILQAVDMKG